MKLYKFRALSNDEDLGRVNDILRTGKFWCSKFWELNDPMEGVYRFDPEKHHPTEIRRFFDEKRSRVLCSFSDRYALRKPIMWGYYANGFKGVAIEIEVNDQDVQKVCYSSQPLDLNDSDTTVPMILSHKLPCWSHENEYRFLFEAHESDELKIGRITRLFVGNPYRTVQNADAVRGRAGLKEYLDRAERVRRVAEAEAIAIRVAWIGDGRVRDREGGCCGTERSRD